MPYQSDWRWCSKCFQLFYNGFTDKGPCPSGGSHNGSQSFNYFLPFDTFETLNAQKDWRYCQKCHSMFFNGFVAKGACTSGGEHEAQGYNFTLPHDVAQTGLSQPGWRYCDKCYAMFFDGSVNKGVCKAGESHRSQGWLFVIPHDLPSYLDFTWTPIIFGNGVPVGGWAHLTIRSDGSYVWSGHFHDSGFPSYDVSIAWGVKDSQNQVYGFTETGHTAGTVEPGSRDHDWNITGRNDAIADRWAFIAAGSTWKASAQSGIDVIVLGKEVKDALGIASTVVSVVGLFV
ncbi:hypothetical protein ACHAPM_011495 [Fusarium culmorum]